MIMQANNNRTNKNIFLTIIIKVIFLYLYPDNIKTNHVNGLYLSKFFFSFYSKRIYIISGRQKPSFFM